VAAAADLTRNILAYAATWKPKGSGCL